MQLTLSIQFDRFDVDIIVDEKQRIADSLKTVCTRLAPKFDIKRINFIKTAREQKVVSVFMTFEEAGIINGDVLKLL